VGAYISFWEPPNTDNLHSIPSLVGISFCKKPCLTLSLVLPYHQRNNIFIFSWDINVHFDKCQTIAKLNGVYIHPQKSNPTSQPIQNPRGIAKSSQHLMSILHNPIDGPPWLSPMGLPWHPLINLFRCAFEVLKI